MGRDPHAPSPSGPASGTAWMPGCGASTPWASWSRRSSSSPAGPMDRRPACGSRWGRAASTPPGCKDLTGLEAGEGQATVLLNDLASWAGFSAGAESFEPASLGACARTQPLHRAARRWLMEVFEPTVERLRERAGARAWTRSRRTATTSRSSGCCPSRPATTSATTRPSGGIAEQADPGGRRRGDGRRRGVAVAPRDAVRGVIGRRGASGRSP